VGVRIANYGSTASEMAVCVKRAGLVERSELEVLELRGAAPWLEHLLSRAMGDHVPTPGRATAVASSWCCRMGEDTALVVGPATSIAVWRRLARGSLIGGSAIHWRDLSASVGLALVGPRAAQVLAAAGLPDDLAVGAVASAQLAGRPVALVREAPHRFLLVAELGEDRAAWEALVAAGRPLGLCCVGEEALEHLSAAGAAARPPVAAA
jgi:glycine cleavage system aminomethyltransferase T